MKLSIKLSRLLESLIESFMTFVNKLSRPPEILIEGFITIVEKPAMHLQGLIEIHMIINKNITTPLIF